MPTYPALTPATGGMSIGKQAVKAGDIIVTTSNGLFSPVIRAVTSGPVSHVMVSIGGNKIIEAAKKPEVREISLDKAMDNDEENDHVTLAVVFRRKSITNDAVKTIVSNVRSEIGKPYNKFGVVMTFLAEHLGSIFSIPLSTDKFYCSQLILTAFASTNFPLLARGNVSAWPTNIVSFDDFGGNLLQYVGHLRG